MKHCPICDERYDEDVIRFCTKDGTPLVDDEQPSFTALPSETTNEVDADVGEVTVIRRKPDTAVVTDAGRFELPPQSERIVIPTSLPPVQEVRPRTTQTYYQPPPPSNTGKTVALTILGTLVVLGFGALIFWLMQNNAPANTNINVNLGNQNTNLNTNLGFDSNFNFNFNSNANFNANYSVNTNFNVNTNTRTPPPTPRPTVSASPLPTPANSPTPPANATPRANANVRPSPSGTPRIGPRPPTLNSNRPPGNGNN